MSTACSVPNCHTKSKVTFHSPQSRAHLELWKKILNINVDNFYVCDQHFEEKFFRIDKRLTVDAFPTQFIGNIDAGSDDFCQCCMKTFVRSKFITQNEQRLPIEEKFQMDFADVIGCDIPSGVVCSKCFETIKNFIKFRTEIREKQVVRDELLKLQAEQAQQYEIDPNIKIKEEPRDDDDGLESVLDIKEETISDASMMKIKDEPMDEDEFVIKQEKIDLGSNESFLISEIKAEPEEMNEIITKPTTIRIANSKLNQKIVIKRPNQGSIVRPMNISNFKIVPPQKVVKIVRNDQFRSIPPGAAHSSAKITNSQGTIKVSQIQVNQNEHSTNMVGFKCQYCPNRFIERRFVVDHIKQKHTFPCNSCPSVFPFKITLIKHQMSMHGGSNGTQGAKTPAYKFICRICGLKFLSNYTLDAHMLQKHQRTMIEEKMNAQDENIIIIRPLQMPSKTTPGPLPTAPKVKTITSSSPQVLQPSTSQIKIKTEDSMKFNSPIQIKTQPIPKKPVNTLIKKILVPSYHKPAPEPIVEDPDGIPCLDCGLLLKPDKLLKHRMDAHDLNTHHLFYFCDLCGLEIKGKTQLINHMTLKHLSSNFVRCEFCDGLFESKTDVICHKNLQHNFNGTRYTCHFCYKIFNSKREMILHRKAHYSEKDSRDKLARVFCKKFKSYEPKGVEYK